MSIRAGLDLPDSLRMVAGTAAFGLFFAALVLAAMLGMRDMFPGQARRRARLWLIVLLALTLILAGLSTKPDPDF